MRFISFFLSCKPLIADKQERHLWYDLPVTSVCVAVFAITISSSCVSRLCLTSFFFPTNATFPSRRHFFTRQLLFFSCSFFAQIPDLSRRWKCLVNAVTVSRGEAVRSEWPLHRRVNGPSVSSLVRSACISAGARKNKAGSTTTVRSLPDTNTICGRTQSTHYKLNSSSSWVAVMLWHI